MYVRMWHQDWDWFHHARPLRIWHAKANLTINNAAVTRCSIWRSSILDWTAVHACSTLSFIISKQLREINFITRFSAFPLMCCFKNSTSKVITGYCDITLWSVFGYSIAIRYSLSLLYIMNSWLYQCTYVLATANGLFLLVFLFQSHWSHTSKNFTGVYLTYCPSHRVLIHLKG